MGVKKVVLLATLLFVGQFGGNVSKGMPASAATPAVGWLPESPPSVFCYSGAPVRGVNTRTRVVTFTFDDGPWPIYTQQIMRDFERRGFRASFFMIGQNAQTYASIARDVARRGHEVANHTMTHRYSPSIIASEMQPAQRAIRQATNRRPHYFRAPGLTQSTIINAEVERLGLCNISTDYDLGDWTSPRVSAALLCERFRNSLRPGYIVLLHDGGSHANTAAAVPCMLDYLISQRYAVIPLHQMMQLGYSLGFR